MKVIVYPQIGYLNSDYSIFVDPVVDKKYKILLDGTELTNYLAGQSQISVKINMPGDHLLEVSFEGGEKICNQIKVYEAIKFGEYPIIAIYPLGKKLPVLVHRQDGLYFHYASGNLIKKVETVMKDFLLVDSFLVVLASGSFSDNSFSSPQRVMVYDLNASQITQKFEGFYLGSNNKSEILFYENQMVYSLSLQRNKRKSLIQKVHLVARRDGIFFFTKNKKLFLFEVPYNRITEIGIFKFIEFTYKKDMILISAAEDYFLYDLNTKVLTTSKISGKPVLLDEHYFINSENGIHWEFYSQPNKLVNSKVENIKFRYSPNRLAVIIEGKQGYYRVLRAKNLADITLFDNSWIHATEIVFLSDNYYVVSRENEKILNALNSPSFAFILPVKFSNLEIIVYNNYDYIILNDDTPEIRSVIIYDPQKDCKLENYLFWSIHTFVRDWGMLVLNHREKIDYKKIIKIESLTCIFEAIIYSIAGQYLVIKNKVMDVKDFSIVRTFKGEYIKIFENLLLTRFENDYHIIELKQNGKKRRTIPGDYIISKIVPSEDQIILSRQKNYII
ncbi:hypothetical protein MASR2M39_04040 [Ignavibacteriales bacterium]